MFIFRADGNAKIGSGHIMRCLSIANAAKNKGEQCLFIMASAEFEEIIVKNGHACQILNTDYSDMESEDILPALSPYAPFAIFVDSYFATEKYLTRLKEYCTEHKCKIIYIDDRCEFAYPCDILLNYNIYADNGSYQKIYSDMITPRLLLGTTFTPLRAEFQNLRDRQVEHRAKNIFVSTGGADAEHLSLDLIQAVTSDSYKFHFIVGAVNSDGPVIKTRAAGNDNIIIHENVSRMAELMQSCDAAISAAGSTLYELCATQTPAITYVLADNQIPGAEGFSSNGIMENCGDIRNLGNRALAERLIHSAASLAENYAKRCRIANAMRSIVDGKGADRIIDAVSNEIFHK